MCTNLTQITAKLVKLDTRPWQEDVSNSVLKRGSMRVLPTAAPLVLIVTTPVIPALVLMIMSVYHVLEMPNWTIAPASANIATINT